MKRFCIKTFSIILPIVILGIILEFALRNIPNDYAYKKTYLDQHSDQIETLILGSSHVYHGLNPAYFDSKAFNAAYYSQTLDFDYEIFKKYEDNMPQLKTVIVTISYFSLFSSLSEGGESWRAKNYAIYCDIGSPGVFEKTEVLGQRFAINMERFAKFYLKRESLITTSELGWGTAYKSEDAKDLDVTGKNAAIRHTEKIRPEIVKANESLLDSLITFCESRNINVILITLPAYKSYRDNMNKEQQTTTLTVANNIAARHHNCVYINMLEDPSFTTKDFYDGDHLNEIGAKKFSLMVSKIVDEMNTKTE